MTTGLGRGDLSEFVCCDQYYQLGLGSHMERVFLLAFDYPYCINLSGVLRVEAGMVILDLRLLLLQGMRILGERLHRRDHTDLRCSPWLLSNFVSAIFQEIDGEFCVTGECVFAILAELVEFEWFFTKACILSSSMKL